MRTRADWPNGPSERSACDTHRRAPSPLCSSRSRTFARRRTKRRDTREELVAAEALESVVIDLETGLRGFVITGEDRFLDPVDDRACCLSRDVARAREPRGRRIPWRWTRSGVSSKRLVGYMRRVRGSRWSAAVRRNDATARSVETTDAGKRRIDALRSALRQVQRSGTRPSRRARSRRRRSRAPRDGRSGRRHRRVGPPDPPLHRLSDAGHRPAASPRCRWRIGSPSGI